MSEELYCQQGVSLTLSPESHLADVTRHQSMLAVIRCRIASTLDPDGKVPIFYCGSELGHYSNHH